jgi:hypothetical protein
VIPLLALLMVYGWGGTHSAWDCSNGRVTTLYENCRSLTPSGPEGADVTRGAGVLSPFFRVELDPLRAQRLADERRVDALLRGDW